MAMGGDRGRVLTEISTTTIICNFNFEKLLLERSLPARETAQHSQCPGKLNKQTNKQTIKNHCTIIMTKKGCILHLLLVLTLSMNGSPPSCCSAFNFRREPKKKKRAREGYKRTKEGWIRLDLAPDSMLRVGVTYRPHDCP